MRINKPHYSYIATAGVSCSIRRLPFFPFFFFSQTKCKHTMAGKLYSMIKPVIVSVSVELAQLVMIFVMLVRGSNTSIVVQLAAILLREASVLLVQVQALQESVRTMTTCA